MKTLQGLLVRAAAAMAAVFSMLLLARLMKAPGTRGLLVWVPSYRAYIWYIVSAGVVPVLLAAAYEAIRRRRPFKGRRLLGRVSLGVSSIVMAVMAAAWIFVTFAPRAVDAPVPALNILDPSRGIPVRGASEGEPYLRLAVSSDPHWGSPNSDEAARSQILDTINDGGYDAFLLLGDIAEQGFPENGLREAAQELALRITDVPIRPMPGNHDALINAIDRWKTYFFPKEHTSDSGSACYYRMDAGKTHFLVLNLLWGEEDFDLDQREWLVSQLKDIPREDAVIVLSHCYFYASGYMDPDSGSPWYDHPGTIQEVSPILEEYGVDLSISGHNHYMELLENNGVTYVLIGAMGGALDPEPSYRSPASRWMKPGAFGFLDLEAYPDRLELIFRGPNGEELHRGRVSVR